MRNEMITLLRKNFPDALNFSLECAIYWFAHDWYDGQADPLYRVLCQSPYHPGCLMGGIDDENDYDTFDMYSLLKKEYA